MRKSWLSLGEVTGFWPLAATVLLGGLSLLALSPQANALPCVSAALSTYTAAGFTCTEGNTTFSAFSYTASMAAGGNAPAASAITVTPSSATNAFGFTFAGTAGATWNANSNNATAGGSLSYALALAAGSGFEITGATATMVGAVTGPAGASAGVSELIGGNPLSVDTANLTNSITFAGVEALSVSKTISVANGTGGGGRTASLSSIADTVSQTSTAPPGVPEPASLGLLATALAGFGAALGWRRRTPR